MTKPKRQRRRDKREDIFGPERIIVLLHPNTSYYTLECGHVVPVHPNEGSNIKRKRCIFCLNSHKEP